MCNPAAAGSKGGSWTRNADPRQTRITEGHCTPPPPRKPTGGHAEGWTPAQKVWGQLGLQEMPTPSSTEHSSMSLWEAPSPGDGGSELDNDEPHSPIQLRNLFGAGDDDAASDDTGSAESGQNSNDAAPQVGVAISAEGYADDTYMIASHLLPVLTMLVPTSKWLKITGQEVNAKKSLAFSATSEVRRKPVTLDATLVGV